MSLIIASAHGEVPTAACGADMFELRIDSMDVERAICSIPDLLRQATLPVVLTCRSTSEGGSFEGNEEDRVAMYTVALSCDNPPRYIDIEHETLLQHPLLLDSLPLGESGVILSWHDTKGRPKDLIQRAAAIQDVANIDVVKMVWRARSLRDNLEAFELLRSRQQPMIAFCVGEYGVMSRVLAPKFGGFATFACTEEHEPTAAGQITAQVLESTYRFRSINSETRVYGVIGDSVSHSRGPAFHNAAFEESGANAVYLPLQVPSGWEHVKATTIELIEHASLDFSGASVTIPHKKDMLKLVVETEGNPDDLCSAAGATNTVKMHEGDMNATNTDVEALISLLNDASHVLVLGAGGVARAAVVAMKSLGASVCVAARNTDQANELAGELSCDVATEQLDNIDTVINCTPVGMHGSDDPEGDPLLQLAPSLELTDAICVVDLVYSPPNTPLVQRAEEVGCKTVRGEALFTVQASLQQKFWSPA
jgi:3-dehydroquinate dehydratase/shikimate dehydrogenase